jgi:hypothetical protein
MNKYICGCAFLVVLSICYVSSENADDLHKYLIRRQRSAHNGLRQDAELKNLVRELMDKLQNIIDTDRALSSALEEESNEIRHKKTGFWPSMGPLPVETRLSSFGSQIGGANNEQASHKPFRYGRK